MSRTKRFILSVLLAALLFCSVPLVGIAEASSTDRRSTHHSRTYHGSNHRYYTNSRGRRVHSPVFSRRAPAGATAEW